MPDQTRFIVFPNYQHAGLSNQFMELEIKVGLALLSGRTLVRPDRICIWSSDEPLRDRVDTSRPKLLDLLDIPVPHLTIEQLDHYPVRTRIQADWAGDGTLESFLRRHAVQHLHLDHPPHARVRGSGATDSVRR